MTTRLIPRTIYDYTHCPHCGAIPDSPCHDINGNIVNTHLKREQRYHAQRAIPRNPTLRQGAIA